MAEVHAVFTFFREMKPRPSMNTPPSNQSMRFLIKEKVCSLSDPQSATFLPTGVWRWNVSQGLARWLGLLGECSSQAMLMGRLSGGDGMRSFMQVLGTRHHRRCMITMGKHASCKLHPALHSRQTDLRLLVA
jgi:hypothetical protein